MIRRNSLCITLLLLLLSANPALATRTASADSLAANYFENNDYQENGFPETLISRDFSIPMDADQILVIYPEGMEDSALHWSRAFRDTSGVELPFVSVETVADEDLAKHHLILLGSINNNPLVYELYKRRYAFSDAYFPGENGYLLHPSRSIWNRDRHAFVIGTSRTDDLDPAFGAFLSNLDPGSGEIGAIRELETELDFPSPPESVQPMLDRVLENAYTSMAPYGTIGNWGLSYHLTGDEQWASHFRDAFYMMRERGRRTGRWISESWTNVYFNLWKMMMAWDLIEDDPYFSDEDREVIEEVLWGYLTFVRWLPNLDPDQAPPGEMRQNHTTFLALSLYFSHRYYTRKYEMEGLEPMMEKVHRAFEEGQANTFVPNDDAGNYLKYSVQHTLTYLMAEDDMRYIDEGHLARATDLLISVFDNRGHQVTFGDVGGHSERDEQSLRDPELMFFSMAAHYYDNPEYRWFYDWIGMEGQKRFSLASLYHGDYVTPMESAGPDRYTGIQTVRMDSPTRQWFGRRAWRNDRLPMVRDAYFHKLAMRRSFDPEDEYLLLGGLSALSHGHHDGNTVLRLTWKDRIWLFDLDYIKFNTKYHNGVTVVRDGVQENPPPLTRLDVEADGGPYGITRTTSENYSGADWSRSILWKKGEWFLFLDDLTALEPGEYRLTGRWRTRGDEVQLSGNRLRVTQGGKSFYIFSADDAARHLEFEEDGTRNNWSGYPWGEEGLDILVAQKRLELDRGDSWRFANLMVASDDLNQPGYRLQKSGDDQYLVTGPESSQLIGTDPADLERFQLSTDADIYILEDSSVYLTNVTFLKGPWGEVGFGEQARHLVIDRSTGSIRNFDGSRVTGPNQHLTAALGFVPEVLQQQEDLGKEVDPAPAVSRVEPFGLEVTDQLSLSRPITARHNSEVGLLTGDSTGRVDLIRDGRTVRRIETPAGAHISALEMGDVNGDGNIELVVGDRAGNLYAYQSDGELLWHHELTPFNGSDASVNDITIGALDDGGRPTVLAGNSGWKVTAVDSDGEIRWESFVFYHMITKVGILDRGDGERFVVAGNAYHSPVNVIDPETGVVQWYTWEEMGSEFVSDTKYFGMNLTEMVFLDADSDGTKEIVFGTLSNDVHAIRAADGERVWSVNAGGEVTVLELFEEQATGSTRILVGNSGGDLKVLSRTGEEIARVDLGAGVTDVEFLPTATGPGGERRDMAVTTDGGELYILDEQLLIRAVHPFEEKLTDVSLEAGHEEGRFRLAAIGEKMIYRVFYEPFVLKRSVHY